VTSINALQGVRKIGDIRSLMGFAKARMSVTQIAKKLKRTPGAVSQKAFALGVRFRSIRRKKR